MKRLTGRAAIWLRGHASLVGALTAGGLAFALYARAIHFGFFGDDPSGHFRYIEEVPWTGWFTTSPGFFLRPLVFATYKLLWLLLGGYVAPGYHLVLLVLHVTNTLLLGVLASSLSHRRTFGWLAAVLFATFPLSHEAVAGVDALAHPLVTFWTLWGLVLFELGRRTGRSRYLWAVHPVLLLALLTHENGLIIPFLIVVLEFVCYPPVSVRSLIHMKSSQYFVLPALYLAWWLQIPKAATAAPRAVSALLRNTLPFLQVAGYPLLPFTRLGVTDWQWLLALVGATLILTFLATRALHIRRLWLLATAWMVMAAVPSVLFLDWDYLHGSPHLYYLASVGAALLWASPSASIIALAKGPVARRAAATVAGALLTLAALLPPVSFVECHLDLWEQATHVVRLVSAQASSAPVGRELVFVNLPAFLTSTEKHPVGCPSTYPFVTAGVVIFPPYADLRDFIRVNGGPDRPARGVTVAEYDPNWPPRYGDVLPLTEMRDTVQQSQVYVFEIGTWSLYDLSAAWQPDAPQAQSPLATFGDAFALEGFSVRQSGSDLVVTLQWRVRSVPAQPLTAFVHIYDRDGKLLAQHDGPPGQNGAPVNTVPLVLWQAGDRIKDVHTILLRDPLPGGYTVAAGLYDPATVRRLPARIPEGVPLRDDLYVLRQ